MTGNDTSCVCIEYCRQHETSIWTTSGSTKALTRKIIRNASSETILGRTLRGFLPEGYPSSVTSDYLGFQTWDSIQALMSYVRGMLCSQAILAGIGVGEQVLGSSAFSFAW